MKLYFILLPVILLVALLQASFLPVFGIYIDFVLIFVLLIVYNTPSTFGTNFSFLSGLLVDLIGSLRFGLFTFMYTLFSIVSYFILNTFGKKLVNLVLLVFVFSILERIFLRNYGDFWDIFLESLFSSLMSLILFPVACFLCEKFGGFKKKLV